MDRTRANPNAVGAGLLGQIGDMNGKRMMQRISPKSPVKSRHCNEQDMKF